MAFWSVEWELKTKVGANSRGLSSAARSAQGTAGGTETETEKGKSKREEN